MKAHRVCAAVGVLALCSTGLGWTGASAAPPIKIPLPAGSLVTNDVPCGPIEFEYSAGETQRVFVDAAGNPRFSVVTGPLTATLTSLVTGKSIALNIPGPVRINAPGVTLYGPALVFGPHEIWLTHGNVFLPGGDPDLATVRGNVVDLCPALQ